MIVVDASVALKWVFDEEFKEEAEAVLIGADVPIAPDFLRIEAANGLWKRVRRGELLGAEAMERLVRLAELPIGWVETSALEAEALRLGVALDHPIYDCCYLALAVRENVLLATADRKFAPLCSKGIIARNRALTTP